MTLGKCRIGEEGSRVRILVVRWLLAATAVMLLIGPARANAALDHSFNDDGILFPEVFGGIDDLAMDGTSFIASGSVDGNPAQLAAFRITRTDSSTARSATVASSRCLATAVGAWASRRGLEAAIGLADGCDCPYWKQPRTSRSSP